MKRCVQTATAAAIFSAAGLATGAAGGPAAATGLPSLSTLVICLAGLLVFGLKIKHSS